MSWLFFTLVNVFANGTVAFLFKRESKRLKITHIEIIFYSFFISVLFFTPFFIFYWLSNGISVERGGFPYFFVAQLFGIIATIYFVKAYSIGEISIIGPLESLRPFFVVILAILFLQEIPTSSMILGTIFIVVGAMLLHFHKNMNLRLDSVQLKPTLYILISTFLYGSNAIIDKKALAYIEPIAYAYFLFIALSLFFGLYLRARGRKFDINLLKNRVIIAIGVLVVIGNVAIFLALKDASPNFVVPVQMTRSLYLAFLGFILLGEKGYIRKIIAALLMLTGVTLLMQ